MYYVAHTYIAQYGIEQDPRFFFEKMCGKIRKLTYILKCLYNQYILKNEKDGHSERFTGQLGSHSETLLLKQTTCVFTYLYIEEGKQ